MFELLEKNKVFIVVINFDMQFKSVHAGSVFVFFKNIFYCEKLNLSGKNIYFFFVYMKFWIPKLGFGRRNVVFRM